MLKALFICDCNYSYAATVFAVRPRLQGDLTQMKKFTSIMLALALTVGVASITAVAQDAPKDDTKKSTKKGKGKKAKDADAKDTTKAPKGKGKGKKAKDADAPAPTK